MENILGAAPPSGSPSDADGLIKDTTAVDFAADVLDAAQSVPVIVDCWSPSCAPCMQLTPILEKTVRAAGGAVRMVKLNVDEAPQIAQQMRLQSIPAVYAFFQGRPIDGFVGALPESEVKQFIDRVIKASGGVPESVAIDEALAKAQSARDNGDPETAIAIYGQILQQDSADARAIAGIGHCYIAMGRMGEAKEMLEAVDDEIAKAPAMAALRSAIDLASEGQESAGQLTDLEAALAANPNDHQVRYDLAVALYGQRRNAEAIEALLAIIAKQPTWNDGEAHNRLLKIFEALGDTYPDTVAGRAKMASILFA